MPWPEQETHLLDGNEEALFLRGQFFLRIKSVVPGPLARVAGLNEQEH